MLDAESVKNDLVNQIVISMWDKIGDEQAKELRNVLYMNLTGYEIKKVSTDVILYDEDSAINYLQKFLIDKKIKGCTDRTLKFYSTSLKKIFETISKSPMDISSDDIRAYIAKRQLVDKVSDNTVNNEIRNLSSFFQWMQVEELRTKNPMKKIGQLKVYKKQKEAFTDIEVETMRNGCKNKRIKAIYELLLSTWCRVSEIAQIKLSEIDGDKILVHGKGKKDRFVYLNAKAQLALKEYLSERRDTNPYLFPRMISIESPEYQKKGIPVKEREFFYRDPAFLEPDKHCGANTIEAVIRKLGRQYDIKAHPHKFRRTGATFALRAGMPIEKVSRILGHADIGVTQIYLDIQEEDVRASHERYVR